MKILIFLLYIITTSLTISYAQSNCVPHQIILLFKNDPTTLYQQALSDPDCLAASTCVDLHPFARTGRYTSDCGETVSALIERFKDHPELELCEPNHYKQTCNTLPDLQYTLQFNTQLNEINWNNKTEPYAGTGNRATVSTPIDDNSEAGFYRLKIDPPTL
jgi:hypothetical protein